MKTINSFNDLKVYSDLMTWFNGRAERIEVVHKKQKATIWTSKDGISIEDAIIIFCEKEKIDIKHEIEAGTGK